MCVELLAESKESKLGFAISGCRLNTTTGNRNFLIGMQYFYAFKEKNHVLYEYFFSELQTYVHLGYDMKTVRDREFRIVMDVT
jgi:hypothetical protein